MTSTKKIKIALFGAFVLLIFVWVIAGTFSKAMYSSKAEVISLLPNQNADDFVGSETCKACHEDQFNTVAMTKHGRLSDLPEWKDKVQNCESCHGAGKAHSEGPSKTNIISFANKNAKEISETCLTCHAGKEAHNNFRRSDHWRNNVGCTDCHSAHGQTYGQSKLGSTTLASRESDLNPPAAMLKMNEQQLCLTCHSEVKSHFGKPFRHKVLEGAMNCSDCHNAHGGFESKQTKLAVGGDAACVKCHSDKQGPFVFEHAPLKVEGCAACHVPHGSANPRMLKRPQVRQLCFECHSGITEQFGDGPTGGPHDQKTLLQRECTACHTMIHGSNSSNVFFR